MARGFVSAALEGLGEIAFSGGRLDPDGSFIAFARLPAPRVNFIASVLPYLDLRSKIATTPDDTGVTWAPLERGGVLLALDEGRQPKMGWVAYASTPERFDWLLEAPRTRAQTPTVGIMVAELDRLLPLVPARWRPYLEPHRNKELAVRVDAEGPTVVVNAVLR